ncbi:MAG: hypothetical protein QOF30_3156, partial [Acidimicrobiaceae bacterium]|nr:hypothetical protein [Acidimicrobiaceae bacterium]
RGPVDRTQATTLSSRIDNGVMHVWLAGEGAVLASAAVTFR